MPRRYIRELRKEAKARREIEEQIEEEERQLNEKKEKLLAEKLGKSVEKVSGAGSVRVEKKALEDEVVDQEPIYALGSEIEEVDDAEMEDRVRWKTTQVIVQAGAMKQVPLEVIPGNYVEWGFKTEGGDIGFAVLLERPDGDILTIVDDDRVDSHEVSIQGSVVVEEKGRLWLQWDNSYSWVTNKDLTYSISLSVSKPQPGDIDASLGQEENGKVHDDAQKEAELQNAGLANGASFKPSILFILGAPGSGKGTQCALMSDQYGFLHLSAGDLLRAERENPQSKDGALIDAYIREGKIVPIEITVKLLLNAMKKNPSPCYLIDGFPRNQDNLDGWTRETGDTVKVVGVLFFDCPEDIITERILERGKSSGRTDDNEESIRKRLATYTNDTMPIIQHFSRQGIVHKIDTNRPVEKIFDDLQVLIGTLFPASKSEQPIEHNSSLPTKTPEPAQENVKVEVIQPPAPRRDSVESTSSNGTSTNNVSTASYKSNIGTSKKPLRVILGTMTMGGQVDAASSELMFDMFVSSKSVLAHLTGGRMEIDTARMYNHGKTEELIGALLSKRPDLKQSLFIATKANPFKGYGDSLRPESVIAQLSESLDDMDVSAVDVFYLHAPDHSTNLEATLEACNILHSQGRFRELGLSNYSAWQTVQIYYMCKERGWVLPSIYQGMYNAITRDVERELLPALKTLGIRFYAYNPLAGGFLSGKHRSIVDVPGAGRFGQHEWGIKYRDRFWKPQYFQALDLVKSVCDKEGISMTAASIRWILHHSRLQGGLNDGIILGASKLEHLEENLKACSGGPLPKDIVDAFENAWEITRVSCPSYSR